MTFVEFSQRKNLIKRIAVTFSGFALGQDENQPLAFLCTAFSIMSGLLAMQLLGIVR